MIPPPAVSTVERRELPERRKGDSHLPRVFGMGSPEDWEQYERELMFPHYAELEKEWKETLAESSRKVDEIIKSAQPDK